MLRALVPFIVLIAMFHGAPPAHAAFIDLDPITTPIVPTELLAGDRDFDGRGPEIRLKLRFSLADEGGAIIAHVTFSARETGEEGDGTATAIGPLDFTVWTAPESDPRRIASINGPLGIEYVIGSPPDCALNCGVPMGAEDGGTLRANHRPAGGPIRTLLFLGDTDGDDVSVEGTAFGNTSVREIDFNKLDVTFAD